MPTVTRQLEGVRLLPSGKYQVRYTGPNGVRYSHGTYRTRADARRALALVEASISNGTWRRKREIADGGLDGRSTLRQWSEEWIALRGRNGKPLATRTVDEYRRLVDSSLRGFADKPVSSITSAQVQSWWSAYRSKAPRAANSAYKFLKSILDRAAARGAIFESPCQIDGACNYQSKNPHDPPSHEQISRLIETTEEPWATFFLLAASCGLRRGELAELRVKDVRIVGEGEQERAEISISRTAIWTSNTEVEVGPTKWNSSRLLALGRDATVRLGTYIAFDVDKSNEEALLFSTDPFGRFHLAESAIRNAVRKAFAKAGIKGSLHSLRHYSLTAWAQGGATLDEIMRRGGHKNVKAALGYQRSVGRDREIADRVEHNRISESQFHS